MPRLSGPRRVLVLAAAALLAGAPIALGQGSSTVKSVRGGPGGGSSGGSVATFSRSGSGPGGSVSTVSGDRFSIRTPREFLLQSPVTAPRAGSWGSRAGGSRGSEREPAVIRVRRPDEPAVDVLAERRRKIEAASAALASNLKARADRAAQRTASGPSPAGAGGAGGAGFAASSAGGGGLGGASAGGGGSGGASLFEWGSSVAQARPAPAGGRRLELSGGAAPAGGVLSTEPEPSALATLIDLTGGEKRLREAIASAMAAASTVRAGAPLPRGVEAEAAAGAAIIMGGSLGAAQPR